MIQFLAALDIFHQDDFEQTTATTIAFSFVFLLLVSGLTATSQKKARFPEIVNLLLVRLPSRIVLGSNPVVFFNHKL